MLTPGESTVRKDEGSHNIHTLNTSRPRDESRDEDEDRARFKQVTNDDCKVSGRSDSNSDAPGKI